MRIERPSLVREAAYERLKRAITEGEFLPGDRLAEPELATRLGVSRTPVREAIQRLAQEGLVELLPGRGARVKRLSPLEVAEVYEVRSAIEAEAARLAAERATDAEIASLARLQARIEALDPDDHKAQTEADLAFHAALVEAAHNRRLGEFFHSLDALLALIKRYSRDQNQSPATLAEHRSIVEALRARDPEAAACAVRRHVERFKNLVLERIEEEA